MAMLSRPYSLSVEDEQYENDCALVHSAVGDIVSAQIIQMEREYDAEKLKAKFYDYLKKAKKSTEGGVWPATIEDFAHKFYQSCYHAFAGRPWLDTCDFSLCVTLAIRAWKPEILAARTQEEYMSVVGTSCTIAHDCARYYAKAWESVKKIVTNKVAQKKVREAVDTAREAVVKTMPPNVEAFIPCWIQTAIEFLAKECHRNNPKNQLSEVDATKLFEELIQTGGGIPMWLELCKPPPGSAEVAGAVNLAYSLYPDPAPREPKGDGKGKYGGGKGKEHIEACGGGEGGFGYGGGDGGFAAGLGMAQQMQQMMAMMMMGGGGGGCGGKGGGKMMGWGPY